MNRKLFCAMATAALIALFSLAACSGSAPPNAAQLEADVADLRTEVAALRAEAPASTLLSTDRRTCGGVARGH